MKKVVLPPPRAKRPSDEGPFDAIPLHLPRVTIPSKIDFGGFEAYRVLNTYPNLMVSGTFHCGHGFELENLRFGPGHPDGISVTSNVLLPDAIHGIASRPFDELLADLVGQDIGTIRAASNGWTLEQWLTVDDRPFPMFCNDIARQFGTAINSSIQRLRSRDLDVLRTFEFPPEHRIACQQYMVYFAQFLADLGLEDSVRFEAAKENFLLRVTPGTTEEAILLIRDALDEYCDLADSPSKAWDLATRTDAASQQLLQQVHLLHSQVAGQRALIESHRSTIQAQQFAIDLMRAKSGELPKARPAPPNDASKPEPILGGLASLGKYDTGKGVTLHWDEMLRKIKRNFGDDGNEPPP